MTGSFDDQAERAWAADRFRQYLLGRLSGEDAERVAQALALEPGLIDELERAEERLIEAYLDYDLHGVDNSDFEARYVHGEDEDDRAKLRVQQALRSAAPKGLGESFPIAARRTPVWMPVAIAACVAAIIFGALYFRQSQQLKSVLAALRESQRGPGQPLEQPAGPAPGGGVMLPGGTLRATRLAVAEAPQRISWGPVPDYTRQYRIRVEPASGNATVSALLTPQDNTISFAVDDAAAKALPWRILILPAEGETAIAEFELVKR